MSKNLVQLNGENGTFCEAIAEAVADGRLPQGTRMGSNRQTPQGWFPKPEGAVGGVRLGYKNQRWLIKPEG
jgi:hypothetical protein